jgi:hypothetical protein
MAYHAAHRNWLVHCGCVSGSKRTISSIHTGRLRREQDARHGRFRRQRGRRQALGRVEDQGGGVLSRANAELGEGGREVALDGALGEVEAACDLAVRQPRDE